MARSKTPAVPAASRGGVAMMMGFLCMGGIVPALVVALWLQPAPAPLVPDSTAGPAEAEETEEELVYVPLDNPVSVALGSQGRRLQAYLAVAVRGKPMDLLALNATVEAKRQPLEAALLVETQAMMAEGADGTELHSALPERLRRVINAGIGTEAWPEPVEEVLITSLVLQE